MEIGVFAYESDDHRFINMILSGRETFPGIPGLSTPLNEDWRNWESV